MKPHKACLVSDLPEGGRKIVELEGRSIGIFNIQGRFHAIKNSCPHQFAPLCRGKITGYNAPSEVGVYNWIREGEIIRCPWHAWEFDILTGQSIFNPHKVRTKSYPLQIGTACDQEPEATVETYAVDIREEAVFVLF